MIHPGVRACGMYPALQQLEDEGMIFGDGGEFDPGPVDAIFVTAGVTHPRTLWLARLRNGGRWLSLVQSLRRDAREPEDTCWLHGNGFCFSQQRPFSPPAVAEGA